MKTGTARAASRWGWSRPPELHAWRRGAAGNDSGWRLDLAQGSLDALASLRAQAKRIGHWAGRFVELTQALPQRAHLTGKGRTHAAHRKVDPKLDAGPKGKFPVQRFADQLGYFATAQHWDVVPWRIDSRPPAGGSVVSRPHRCYAHIVSYRRACAASLRGTLTSNERAPGERGATVPKHLTSTHPDPYRSPPSIGPRVRVTRTRRPACC